MTNLDSLPAGPARHTLLADENAALIDNALDLMAVVDADGTILRVNAAARVLLGFEPDELAGRHYNLLVHPEQHTEARGIQLSLQQEHPERPDILLRVRRRDGRVILMSVSARWSDAHRRMFVTARDVSNHVRAHMALERSESALNGMLESIGDAFFAVDSGWRLTYANRKAGDFVGVDADAVIGRPLLEVAPELRDSPTLQRYQHAMHTREPVTFEVIWEPRQVWLEVRVYPNGDGISVYFHEITTRREAEQALKKSERRFREIIELTPSGYLLADGGGALLEVNPALCTLTGHAREELLGASLQSLFLSFPWAILQDGESGEFAVQGVEAVLRHRQGYQIHVLFNGSIKRGPDGRTVSLTGLMTDITDRKAAESRLRELATHDTLTGLPNRALLGERVQHMLDACPQGGTVAVMFLDLDRFKEVNDSFGHELGDVLLCEVAGRLRRVIDSGDVIARLGGDEFVVAAACTGGRAAAERTAARLLDVLTAPVSVGGIDVIVGASIGISMFPQDARTRETLFQTADTAMYRAKNAGRNRFRFFEAEMTVATQVRMALEVSLRPALARGEFELHYQPRYDLAGMAPVGMEALIRWNHPERGRVPPQQFIAIAEETGLVVPIGRWVLHEACVRTRALMDEFERKMVVSVNVSARQLGHAGFVDEVRAVLAQTGLPPECLELELTESALIEDIEHTAAMLRELKHTGVALAVDDFGTGASSLAYLRRFPIDVLKLDRSFVLQKDGNVTTSDFVKAFVDLAHALNMAVVAEGVETAEVLDLLRAARCDQAQGYLLARPMPLEELRGILR